MNRRSLGIRAKLTLWYALTLALLLVGFGLALDLLVHASLEAQLHRQLDGHLAAIAGALRGAPDDLAELDRHGAAGLFIVREQGKRIYQSHDWEALGPPDSVDYGAAGTTQSALGRDMRELRLLTDRIEIGSRHVDVIVAVSEEAAHETLATMRRYLLIGSLAVAVVSLVGGYFLADRLLGPIRSITAKARRITFDRLGERVPLPNRADELGQLATVINELLGRLEDSFERLRRFTSDASHELRTPLGAIRAVGEAALRGSGDVRGLQTAIGSMLEEADRLNTLVEKLLALARADADRYVASKKAVDLNALVRETVEIMQIKAEEKNQTLRCEVDGRIESFCDSARLREALLNLLENAILYTPAEGMIVVTTRTDGNAMAMIEVADNGPGIAPEHAERVFERFYRIDKEDRGHPCTGLGLALARWAIEINDGRIELESEPGKGSTFRIVLPRHTTAKSIT